MKKFKILNSNTLKILAMVLMLLDHLWATIVPGNQWMTNIGRMSFPIFAFLIVEGFIHTSNFKKYLKRLFVFALISEIPFNLIYAGSWIFPFHQNVLFTLLLGLLCINEIDLMNKTTSFKFKLVSILRIIFFLLISIIGFVDYGLTGVLTIIVFFVFRNCKLSWLWEIISLILLYIVFFKGQSIIINFGSYEYFLPIQGISILSLIPIGLYNGTKGKKSKFIQYAFYWFYPLHMALIYLIYYFCF